jgi:multidrug efflux system membrane fusion protein
VIQGGVAHERSIKAGVTDGGNTQVDGVEPGEVVATSSFDKLQDKAAVAVSNRSARRGAGSSAAR